MEKQLRSLARLAQAAHVRAIESESDQVLEIFENDVEALYFAIVPHAHYEDFLDWMECI